MLGKAKSEGNHIRLVEGRMKEKDERKRRRGGKETVEDNNTKEHARLFDSQVTKHVPPGAG